MDTEHELVFGAVEQLRQAILAGSLRGDIERELRRLSNHLGAHFLGEEALMRASRYSGLHWHEDQHRAGLRKLAAVDEATRGQWHDAVPFLKMFATWLTDHITVADRMFCAHLRNHQRMRG